MTDYTVAVLEDALQILEILGGCRDGLTLAEITTASGFVKNKVFRILYTLEKHDIVKRNEQGVYRLGYRLLELSHCVEAETLLIEASRPAMNRLVAETSESIFLGVATGSDAVCIAACESPQSIRLFAQVGRRAPLHSGGVPKVLLAFMPDDERERILNGFFADRDMLPKLGITRKILEQQLAEVRQQGYAIIIDELDMGAQSIAAPIFNRHGDVIAGISIAGPSTRFTPERVEKYIELVQAAAEEISHSLGQRPQQAESNGLTMSG